MNSRHNANFRSCRWLGALPLTIFLIAPVWAQAVPDRHPSDPTAPAPATEYRSAFADYQSLLDSERKSWRSANEEAGESGGHASHFMPRRQQDDPKPAKDKKPEATNPPSGGGHGRHGRH